MVLKGIGWDGDPESLKTDAFKDYINLIPDVSERDVFLSGNSRNKVDLVNIKKDYNRTELIQRKAERDTWSASEINTLYNDSIKHKPNADIRLSSINSDSFLTEDNYADFGTYCHKIIETKLKNTSTDVLLPSSFLNFQNKQKEIIEMDAHNLAAKFLDSAFAKENIIFDSESELSFLLNIGEFEKPLYVNGQIDLLIEKKDKVLIIDFKTDKSLNPEEYGVQMFLYREAAGGIFDKPVRSFLFYLRETIETEIVDDFFISDICKVLE
ncbi:MAG: PD-(D/E)XK nuclease family protein [Spirochaetia bacterium]|nr:PD-(D/E)XK nuclease family protein [Spirochaetia bacterium]